MRRYVMLAATAVGGLSLSACTYLEDGFHNMDSELTYGENPEERTTKVDERSDYAKKKYKISSYMWRASLRAVNTLPLLSSDATTGLIVTDWYSAPTDPDDRRKVTIKVLGDDIRRDMLRVSVERQVRTQGVWSDVAPYPGLAHVFEDNILKDAKDIRGW